MMKTITEVFILALYYLSAALKVFAFLPSCLKMNRNNVGNAHFPKYDIPFSAFDYGTGHIRPSGLFHYSIRTNF